MQDDELARRLRKLDWRPPSDALRARVLSVTVVTSPVSWSDRVWFSRAWRFAGAAAFLGLLAIEPVSGRLPSTSATVVSKAFDDPQVTAMADTGRQIGFPGDVMSSLARRPLAESVSPSAAEQQARQALEREALDPQGGRQ